MTPVGSHSRHSSLPLNIISLTRELVDIESISGDEAQVGEFLATRLASLGYFVDRIAVGAARFNVLARPTQQTSPAVVFSTHMDTVPPYIASSESGGRIYGRGACDAKGIIAAQVFACERLRAEGHDVGLLLVVGEESDGAGAKAANALRPACKYLINGEPTSNRIALATKGALRVDLAAEGRMAHSGYPELGESAIEKLVEALHGLRLIEMPVDAEIGPTTMNIGLIEGGRAPNVVPDHAKASLLFRTVGSTEELRERITSAVGALARIEYCYEVPFLRMKPVSSLPTMIASFFTDIPSLTNWGQPVLIGPGDIQVAHTAHEYIEISELLAAVDIYREIAKKLLADAKL